MASAKKKVKKSKFKLSKRSIIFVSIAGVLLLIAGGFWLRSYLVEKQTLADLSNVNEDVYTAYSQLLDFSNGNVASSNYGNSCSESSVEIGKGRIVCWVGGSIELKQDIGLEAASNALESSVVGNTLDSGAEAVISDSQYSRGVNVNYTSLYKDIVCNGSYGQNVSTGTWLYRVSCRVEAPDFLPGYTVEQ